MRLPFSQSPRGLGIFLLYSSSRLIASVAAEYILQTTSLSTCQDNSEFSASLFDVVYTPGNNTAAVDMTATSTVEGYVIFDIAITAYGYQILRTTIDPCAAGDGFKGFCPMSPGNLNNPFNIPIDSSATSTIPSIAYTFPNIDAKVKVFINYTDSSEGSVACVQASVSNGKTVDLVGVKWASAIVAGLALASSALMSGLGHQNAASHVAANALSLCGYFQAQAMVGLVAVPLPPVVQAWTQDFQWSIGIIYVGFMQDIFTWYQRATGGTPSTLFNSLTTVSVQVQKRSEPLTQPAVNLFRRATAMAPRGVVRTASNLVRRTGNIQTTSGDYIVYGIQRVAFQAGIESTNIFMTGLVFYCLILIFTAISVLAWKYLCEALVKSKFMKPDTFADFRSDWRTHLKGILFRITLIGFAPMSILCLWELTQDGRDSAAEIVLAVGFFFGILAALGWAAYNVIRLARRSIALHKNPAYALFSDDHALNKWGFLYIQFRASAYYFIVPSLGYALLKSMFIALGQRAYVVQAIALIIIEAGALIGVTVIRPWMDKKTNAFNIVICVVNFLNAIFLLIFTDIFDQPGLFTGIVGILLWILNAAVTLVLLIILLISTIVIFFKNNPDGRYRMADDRTSFMKSQSKLDTTLQLDALAATARGDKEGGYGRVSPDEDDESANTSQFSTDSPRYARMDPADSIHHHRVSMLSTTDSTTNASLRDLSRPPVPMSPLSGQPSMPSMHNASPNGSGGYKRQNNSRQDDSPLIVARPEQ